MNDMMRQALSGLANRMPRVVREHEVLRVAGWIPGKYPQGTAKLAIEEVLKWAQKRSGGQLPSEAWEQQSFEYFSGGRNGNCIRLQASGSDIWAIRADDPDKTVPQRIWTTEVVVGLMRDQPPKFSARLMVSTPEDELSITPYVPGFVQQVVETCGLVRGTQAISLGPQIVDSDADIDDLLSDLVDPDRQLPIFVITLPSAQYNEHPFLDVDELQRATLGLARVVIVAPSHTWALSNNLGKQRSVFGGAVRAYLPGFTEDADPFAHRLVLFDQVNNADGARRCKTWIQGLAASESTRRAKLGGQVLAFSAIRTASLQFRQSALKSEGASDADQLAIALDRVAALESELDEQRAEQDYYLAEYEKERERAEAAERQTQASAYRIQQLTEQFRAKGDQPDENIALPDNWDDLPDWCDQFLAGRLAITTTARRNLKNPQFRDVDQVARCLLWLANTCRESRLDGGGGTLREVTVEDGIRNSPCGSDTYDFDWQGRRLSADWHIKNGGNTRAPSRCLRIYYCFDEQTQQIVVSDMPAHRRTGAT